MTLLLDAPPTSFSRAATRAAGLIVLLGGAVILVGGWLLGNEPLQSLISGLPYIVPNTALGFTLLGAALLLLESGGVARQRLLGRVCAALALLLGLLTLGEYLFNWNLGIDQFLLWDTNTADDAAYPGRPSPQVAMSGSATGLALLLLEAETARRRRPAQYLASFSGLIGLLALLSYLYGVAPVSEGSPFTGMSIVTAVLFLILTLGILLARPHVGFMAVIFSDSAGGFMARRLLPAALIVPSALGWLILLGLRSYPFELNFAFAMFVLLNVVVFATVIWWNATLLDRMDAERQQAGAEIRRLNDSLKARASELETTNKELETFSYSVSHDLRAPLRAIEGFSQLLREQHGAGLDDDGLLLLDRTQEATQRMKQLIDDLLSFSRLARMEMYRASIDFSAMGQEIVRVLRDMHPDRQVDVVIEPGMSVEGDPRLLRIVLENLLNNAWKFTRYQAHPRIEFGRLRDGAGQTYFVRDNGVGFDMAYAGKLFGAFQRLHSESEFEGTGIGLATVQRIILRHGGRIWAEGKVNEGATFYFSL